MNCIITWEGELMTEKLSDVCKELEDKGIPKGAKEENAVQFGNYSCPRCRSTLSEEEFYKETVAEEEFGEDDGHEVLNPWDYFYESEIKQIEEVNDYDKKRNKFHDLNIQIGKKNKELIDECDLVFAVLDGSDVDSGVASEIGYAYGRGKKIIGYRNDLRESGENIGCEVNLQVQYWIEDSGGEIMKSKNTFTKIPFK